MLDIKITKTTQPKEKPAQGQKLGFGKIFTDHMFVMNYTEGKGWHDPRIEPFHNISLSPAAMVYHYGQEMFEGLKAYRTPDGTIQLFRPDKNIERMNQTNDRLCIPRIPEEDFVQAVKELVAVDDISFKLIIDGNVKLETIGDGNVRNAIYSIFGKEFSAKLVPTELEVDGIGVKGFVGRPDNVRANRNYQNFFINGRYVKSRTACAALEQAYTSYIAPRSCRSCGTCLPRDHQGPTGNL